ncbi:hypothetical protein CHS0354_012714 [Potamilus streckersoni]|uniref:Uncharacterized protein n=1 Tax=Potamilus streckersoni TaxID=2493646 RepID=A0AAE0SYD3_9BIVA|nr:hypothetical protein CHS0354_012714 [Potamilus streckersoni]
MGNHCASVKYLDECPREPKLPIYLLVGGIFGTIKVTLLLCTQLQRIRGDEGDEIRDDGDPFTMGKVVNIGLSLFLSVWFALGNYWLFKTGKPNYLPPLHEPRNWCDRTVHMFTFWHVIVCYILIGTIFLLGFVFVCCFACLKLVGENEKG